MPFSEEWYKMFVKLIYKVMWIKKETGQLCLLIISHFIFNFMMRTSLGYAIKLVQWVDELQILNCGTAPNNRRFWCMLCDVQRASIDSGGFGSTPVWAFFFYHDKVLLCFTWIIRLFWPNSLWQNHSSQLKMVFKPENH